MNLARALFTSALVPAWIGCIGDPGARAPEARPSEDERRDPLDFRDGTATSSDGVAIHYREGGAGETALVFVHGWLGNANWWEPLMRHFAPTQRVVALDLAGHGRSGKERDDWTVERFSDDVASVVRALGLERVVLLGHSMSGAISVQAARELGERVVLLVPVDTLNDVEWDLPPEVWDEFFGGLRADFPNAVEGFFRNILFAPSSPPAVVERVVAEARAADPALAVPMLERAREFDTKAALRELDVPIHAINSDLNPTKLETNRKYAPRFEVEVMTGVGHWPMLEAPEAFARALEKVLAAPR
jgi:pimeloyl-ACP methyl ester carboxylesterase